MGLNGIETRFAFLPRVVSTWRGTKALIWLQTYCVDTGSYFVPLNGDDNDSPWCNKLGFLSLEF